MNTLDQTFTEHDFSNAKFKRGEYDNCTFVNCNFERADVGNTTFLECTFKDCNMANAIVANASFKEVTFMGCKLIGINFSTCNPFMLEYAFQSCDLSLSSFEEMDLKNQLFYHCMLKESDFTSAQLPGASFIGCDLNRAVFHKTNLERANFTTADNVVIDPETNHLKGAQFSSNNVLGLLTKYGIIVK